MEKKSFLILIIVISIILLGSLSGSAYYICFNILNAETIYPGISIGNYDCSNKTIEQALDYIKKEIEIQDFDKYIKLFGNDYSYKISLLQVDFDYNYDKAIELAYQIGRQGNYLDRIKEIRSLKKSPRNIHLESFYDISKLEDIVDKIANEINRESGEAIFDFNNGDIQIKEEVIGKALNKKELTLLIHRSLYSLKDIVLPIEDINPRINKEFYSRINGVIGEFSTSFKNSGWGRIENIRLSAQSLNNKMLLPGEEMSYNDTTGPREKKYGYQEAPVIIAGEYMPGVGGGVCQTSTTLYNALLLADITITERHNHSIPPSYINKGEDAVVANGYMDLRFRNDFDYPIYFHTRVQGDRVYIYIYGDAESRDYFVKIESETVEVVPYKVNEIINPNLASGTRKLVQEGRNGYKVNTYKSIIKDGKMISKKIITSDYYRERDYIYNIGGS